MAVHSTYAERQFTSKLGQNFALKVLLVLQAAGRAMESHQHVNHLRGGPDKTSAND